MPRESRFGHYRLIELLGRGGMGEVWLARHEMLNREVAIKLIRPGADSEGEGALRRFEREAQATSRLRSPHTIQIYDFGITDEGTFFSVMELLQGLDLRSFVETYGTLQPERVVFVLRQVCDSLAEAHHNGLIHRDIKPANIFLCQLGLSYDFVKVLDFGLVKMTAPTERDVYLSAANRTVGTPAFMPPEIARGDTNVDARADIYALGCVAYYLLTGQPVFESDNAMQVMVAHLEHRPDPPSVRSGQMIPKKLERIIMDCLEKRPDDRPGSARELMERLARISFDEPWTEERAERWWRMHRPLWMVRDTAGTAGEMGEKRPSTSAWTLLPRRVLTVLLAAAAGGLLSIVGLEQLEQKRLDPGSAPLPHLKPITFGMSGAFSGPNRELGRAVRDGITAHFREVDDAGGIGGRSPRLVALDDGFEPGRARGNMVELIRKRRVFAVIGNVGTPTARQAVPLAIRSKVPVIGALSGSELLRRNPPDRYVFNYRASYIQETAALIGYFDKVLRIAPGQIAVFAQKDSYGKEGYRGVVKALQEQGHDEKQEIVRAQYQRNTLEIEDAVRTVAQNRERVRAVVMVASYRPAARFVKALKDLEIEVVLAGVSLVGGQAFAEELMQLGKGYAEGVIVTQVVPHPESQFAGVLRYRKQLQKYYPEETPCFKSLEGYIVANIVSEALRRIGRQPITRMRLVQALESLRALDLGIGTTISFGPNDHQGSDRVWGTVLDADGRFQPLSLE